MSRVLPVQSVGVAENGCRLLEGHAMLCRVEMDFLASQANTYCIYAN